MTGCPSNNTTPAAEGHSQERKSGERYLLLLLLLFALSVRIFVYSQTPVISTDSFAFLKNARLFAHNNFSEGLQHSYHPLYPMLVALVHTVIKNYESAGASVSIILGTLTLLPLFFLAKRLFNARIALLACFLLAIHPYHIRLSADVMSDVPYYFFYLTGVWLLWVALDQNSWSRLALSGAITGLAYLTRPEGVELLLISCFFIGIVHIKNLPKDFHLRAAKMALVAACFLAVSSWYLVTIHKITGNWQLTMKGSVTVTEPIDTEDAAVLLKANNGSVATQNMADDSKRIAYYVSKDDYIGIIAYTINEFIKSTYYPLFLLLLIGLFWRGGQKFPFSSDFYLLVFVFLHFFVLERLLITRYYVSVRHLTCIVILALPWMGIGIVKLEGILAERLWRGKDSGEPTPPPHPGLLALSRPLGLLLVAMVILTLPKGIKPKRYNELALKSAGVWLRNYQKENFPDRAFSIVGSEKTAYYAGATNWYPLPEEIDYPAMMDYIRQLPEPTAQYLVVYKEQLKNASPNLALQIFSSTELELLNQWTEYTEKNDFDTLCLFKLK